MHPHPDPRPRQALALRRLSARLPRPQGQEGEKAARGLALGLDGLARVFDRFRVAEEPRSQE